MGKYEILLVNDDGFLCNALPLTISALEGLGNLTVVVPEVPKSGGGHAVTLHKPIFVRRTVVNGKEVHVINGTPVDAIHVAVNVLGIKPDLVVSGVNIGENTSVQNILYSGTVEAAVEAGLFGFPAVAFSADVGSDDELSNTDYAEMVKVVVRGIASYILEKGWFEGVDALSINIPRHARPLGAVLARAQRIRFIQQYERRVDPRGRSYYWLVGKKITEPGFDSYYLENGYVVITPLRSDLTHPGISGCWALPDNINELISYINGLIKDLQRGTAK